MCRPCAVAVLAAGTLVSWSVLFREPAPSKTADTAFAQSAIVWVFLNRDSVRAVSLPATAEHGGVRRDPHTGLAFEDDAPIPAELVQRVAAAGAHIRYASRWLRAISVKADGAALQALSALPFVTGFRPVGRIERAGADAGPVMLNALASRSDPVAPGTPDRTAYQAPDSAFYGSNWSTVRELGVHIVHAFFFTGRGVRIAILDTGFEPRHEALVGRRVIAARDFINGDTIVYNEPGDPPTFDQARHGTQVWSLIGALRPGRLVGMAYDAEIILAKVDAEPGNTQADEDRWVAAMEWAESLGARIIASSLVFRDFLDKASIPYSALNGDGTVTTQVAEAAARRGILVVVPMGNRGPAPGTLSSPADGRSIVAVGAVDAQGQPVAFGNQATARGPTADGRIKPDLAARGIDLAAATSVSLSGYEISLAGSSYAAALIAGGAALVMQAWPELTTSAIQRAMLLSARRATEPDNARGHGVPDLAAAILFPDGLAQTNVAPVDLQGSVTTITPTLNWRASLVKGELRPVRYRVEIASDSLFNSIVYSDTVSEAFSLTTRRALRPATRLHWRVQATAQLGITATSGPGTPFAVPSWIRLLAPAGNQVTFVNTPRPELSWTPLSAPPPVGPLVYDVEILSNLTGQLVQPTLRGVTAATVRVPQPLVPNTAYRWRVIARAQTGQVDTVESVAPFVVTSDTQPPATLLYQNFPNPFPRPDLGTDVTNVWFDLAERSGVELTILDLRGRLVRRLIPADPSCGAVELDPGIYGRGADSANPCISTEWDGRDEQGRTVPRGIYVLRLRAAGKTESRRVLFLPG